MLSIRLRELREIVTVLKIALSSYIICIHVLNILARLIIKITVDDLRKLATVCLEFGGVPREYWVVISNPLYGRVVHPGDKYCRR